MDGCEILPASLWDLRGILRLENLCFADDAWPIWDVAGMLAFPGELRLKAVRDGRLVGFIAGEPSWREGISIVTTLGVDPEYRGRGIGSALLEACEALLPGRRIHLTVKEGNRPAIQLYERSGYRFLSRIANYYQHGETGILMEKLRPEAGQRPVSPDAAG